MEQERWKIQSERKKERDTEIKVSKQRTAMTKRQQHNNDVDKTSERENEKKEGWEARL